MSKNQIFAKDLCTKYYPLFSNPSNKRSLSAFYSKTASTTTKHNVLCSPSTQDNSCPLTKLSFLFTGSTVDYLNDDTSITCHDVNCGDESLQGFEMKFIEVEGLITFKDVETTSLQLENTTIQQPASNSNNAVLFQQQKQQLIVATNWITRDVPIQFRHTFFMHKFKADITLQSTHKIICETFNILDVTNRIISDRYTTTPNPLLLNPSSSPLPPPKQVSEPKKKKESKVDTSKEVDTFVYAEVDMGAEEYKSCGPPDKDGLYREKGVARPKAVALPDEAEMRALAYGIEDDAEGEEETFADGGEIVEETIVDEVVVGGEKKVEGQKDVLPALTEEEIESNLIKEKEKEKKREANKKKKERAKENKKKEEENKKKEEDAFKLFEEEAKKEKVELMEKKRAKILENVEKAKAETAKKEHDALLQSFIDDDSMEEKNLIEREKKIRADLKAETITQRLWNEFRNS